MPLEDSVADARAGRRCYPAGVIAPSEPEPATPAAVRTVVVRPASARRETVLVVKALFHILFWSSVVIAVERGLARPDGPATTASVTASATGGLGEVSFRTLASADQLVFRKLREGVIEAERARARSGAWPSIAELAGRDVPPFASDPTEPSPYAWSVLRRDLTINYLGLPKAATGRPTFVVVILEPDPKVPIDPQAPSDEIHHRLTDGTMLHVSIWTAPGRRPETEPIALPALEDGWRRITML